MEKKIYPIIFQHRGNVTNEQVIENIKTNACRDLPFVNFNRVCLCGSGPSLKDQIDKIKKRISLGFEVASVNGAYNFLQDHGIVSDYFFMIDAREGINLPFIDRPHKDTQFIIASQCHPEIFETLKDQNVWLWQVDNYTGAGDAIREASPRTTIFGGASNVGHSCMAPLMAMGFRIMHIFGFDGPVLAPDEAEIKKPQHSFDQPQNDGEEQIEVFFEGSRFLGTGTNAHDANVFVDRYHQFKSLGIDIQIYGDNLLQRLVRSRTSSQTNITIPAPKPRAKRDDDRLRIVLWKWEGHIPYTAGHVNRQARLIDKWLKQPHEIVCITDDPKGIDGSIRIVPLWKDHFEYGRDWHRLKIFSPEMVDLIGPRFVSIDLDTLILGPLDPLFDNDAPFKALQDFYWQHQYATGMFQMDAGAYPFVLDRFDVNAAMKLRESGSYIGYDQAWISHVLPGAPVWTRNDGILSFKRDIICGEELPGFADVPSDARMIFFHGKFHPDDEDVKKCCPWINL